MIPSVKIRLALACAGVAMAVACGGGEKAADTAAPATTAPAASAGGASSIVADGEFGVAECDNYVKKYVGCVESKVPEAARAQMKQAFEQTKAAWKQAAATPAGKAALAQGCTQAEAASKTAMAAYGCQW
jgi:hypothetical protein